MAGGSNVSVRSFCLTLAVHPLDDRCGFRGVCGADDLFPCAPRETMVPVHSAWGYLFPSPAGWGCQYLLGIYYARYFENYNRLYGTLGGVMALMTWLYWAYFIFLAGGELNAELAKARRAELLRGYGPANARSDDRAA